MTKEAFEVYARAIKPEGLIAIHISNRHFELAPLIFKIAEAIGHQSMLVSTQKHEALSTAASQWLFLSKDPAKLQRIGRASNRLCQQLRIPADSHLFFSPDPQALATAPLWTDDESNLLDAAPGLRFWE